MYRMKAALEAQREAAPESSPAHERFHTVHILTGKHDEIWKEGTQLAKSLANAVEQLISMEL